MTAGVPELLLPILDEFETTTRDAIGRLGPILSAGKIRESAPEFHQLRGASGTLGLRDFYERCAQLEGRAAEGDPVAATELVDLLDLLSSSVAAARTFLEQPARDES